ncbi:hypothetical protein BPOR_0914g00020 [Botrytis porri]|uniref:Uncharacterized protein n=1 Tax=Botrytis porri TaxID=87229 RepID=A0A4Z1K9I9_9HELO|nr:hypothetical protein BPOR_0914g00020 [Botrytis porri]
METKFCLEKVQLGELDCALKLIGTHLLNHRIGNVMWQSPEEQLGSGIGKHPGKRAEMVDIMTDPYLDGVGSKGFLGTEEYFEDGAI